jgi:hypothetical protein
MWGFSPNRKVLLALSAGQFTLHRVIGFLKCIEIDFVQPDENDVFIYSYAR